MSNEFNLIDLIREFTFSLYMVLYNSMDIRVAGCIIDWDLAMEDGEELLRVYIGFPRLTKTATYTTTIEEFLDEFNLEDREGCELYVAEAFSMVLESIGDEG